MRVGILLPWVGGDLPPHLSFTCRSMAGGAATATLLLIHEASQRRSVAPACREVANVEVVELRDGGVAALHASRLAARGGGDGAALAVKLGRLFRSTPGALSEFKPAWGHVFGSYLGRFSHWTYTDADVVFGDLDAWLGPRLGAGVDVETWAFAGDAGRLFLRGQWTVHRIGGAADFLWEACDHLGARLEENVDYKLAHARALAESGDRRATRRAERAASDATAGGWDAAAAAARLDARGLGACGGSLAAFVSAEGCYSCAVLTGDAAAARGLVAAVAPLAHSDHEPSPVYWFRGRLARCAGEDCAARLRAWKRSVRGGRAAPPSAPAPAAAATAAAVVVRDCDDMRWICRTAPRAALHALAAPAAAGAPPPPLGPGDAVRVEPRPGRDALPAATIVAAAPNRDAAGVAELPLFHFRKWVDYGAWRPAADPGGAAPFVVEESGFRAAPPRRARPRAAAPSGRAVGRAVPRRS